MYICVRACACARVRVRMCMLACLRACLPIIHSLITYRSCLLPKADIGFLQHYHHHQYDGHSSTKDPDTT